MPTEIEAKFLDINHDDVREKLKKLGAVLEHPMRLMRRTMFDFPDKRFKAAHKRLRIRDEEHQLTVTFKQRGKTDYAEELETTIGSYKNMEQILNAVGLDSFSYQESKRETWKYKNVEVVLDQWPWLNDYIEIEGPDEQSIKEAAQELGFDWDNAKFGSVDTAYRIQYPGMKRSESIGEVPEVRFDLPLPEYLKKRMKK